MGSVLLCQRQLAEVDELVADKYLRREAQKRVRLLDPKRQKALKKWATAELAKLESRPGSGFSKVVRTEELRRIARRMAVLQAALTFKPQSTPQIPCPSEHGLSAPSPA